MPPPLPISAVPTPLRGIFVAGTDTGVGKTEVACAILRHARDTGRRVLPFKPVETGADPLARDARRLYEAAGPAVPLASVCLYPLALPAAPQAAAEHVGVTISPDRILERAHQLATAADALVVEAAGGLLAPYAQDFSGADLARLLGLPILLVGRTGLGTINHVALSLNEIRRRCLPFLGLILCQTEAQRSPHEPSNLPLIRQITGVQALGILPHLLNPTPDGLAQALADALAPIDLAHLLAELAPPPSQRKS
jgi:dethiobiotin synthetase